MCVYDAPYLVIDGREIEIARALWEGIQGCCNNEKGARAHRFLKLLEYLAI